MTGMREIVLTTDGSEAPCDSYDVWQARRDLERLTFAFRNSDLPQPYELTRLRRFVERLDRC